MRCRSLLTPIVTLTVAASLGAQDFSEFCRANPRLAVGQWASFRYSGGSMDGSTMRWAIVGSERQGDSTFLWYEIKIDDPKHPNRSPSITQILGQGFGTPNFSVHG